MFPQCLSKVFPSMSFQHDVPSMSFQSLFLHGTMHGIWKNFNHTRPSLNFFSGYSTTMVQKKLRKNSISTRPPPKKYIFSFPATVVVALLPVCSDRTDQQPWEMQQSRAIPETIRISRRKKNYIFTIITRSEILYTKKLQDFNDHSEVRTISKIAWGNRSKSPGTPPNDPAERLKSLRRIYFCLPAASAGGSCTTMIHGN